MSAKSLKRSWSRRFKMMMRHTWLIAIAGMLLCAGVAAAAFHILTQPVTLTIAVGPPNSEDARVVQAMTQQLARDRSSVRLKPLIQEGGTRDAMAAIDKGTADFAIVRRDIGMPKEGLAVAIWRKNVAVFIVPDQPAPARPARRAAAAPKLPKIEKVENLVGRRLGVVGRSPTNIALLRAVLMQYSISPDKIVVLGPGEESKPNERDKITVVQFDPSNVGTAIREAKIKADAILSVGPVGSSITADAIAAATRGKEAPSFLELNASEAIAERNPVYEATEIKAGAFGGAPAQPEETIETIGVNHYLVARRKLSDDVVADFTKHLFAIRQALAVEIPSSAKIEAPGHLQGRTGAGASRRRRLHRRRDEDLLRPLQRPAVLGPDDRLVLRLGAGRPDELQQERRPYAPHEGVGEAARHHPVRARRGNHPGARRIAGRDGQGARRNGAGGREQRAR